MSEFPQDNRPDLEKGPGLVGAGSDSEVAKEIKKPLGIRKIEVLSKQYQVKGKIFMFFMIFLVAYVYGLDGQTRYVYQATATASYSSHSLLSTINVVQAVVAAASQPFIARLSDVFGRVSLIIVSVILYAVGTVIESQAFNVQRYAGGAVIYQVGYTGLMLLLQLIVADMSNLNWRLLCSFIPALPFIINTWVNGLITEKMVDHWSWGIGMFAIIMPVVALPLIAGFFHMHYLAKKRGDYEQFKHEKTDFQNLGFSRFMISLFWKLDVVGIILMSAALALILVPLTLAGGLEAEWKRAKIIAPIVIGFVCIPAFFVWEAYCPFPVTPFKLLKDRGVWAALCIGVFINWIWYMQGDYMYTVLVVAVNESVKSANRITSLYSFVSVITGSLLGFVVARFRHVKPFIIFGAFMWLIAMGLLVKFRGGDASHSGIIGSLCLLGFGAGFFTYPTQTSIQACTKHEHMGVITALYLTMYNIGSGFGGAVSGGLWTQLLPKKLTEELSQFNNETMVAMAYGDPFSFILEYPWGTPEREAVVVSYQYIQRIMCITGTCLVVPLLVLVFLTRDKRLESVQSLDNAETESTSTAKSLRERVAGLIQRD